MSGKITKADIIEALHETSSISKKEIHGIIDGLFDQVKKAILSGHIVELRGFGTFEVKVRKGKKHARNPKTGDLVSVPDHGVASFRPGRELKQEAWKLLQGPTPPSPND